MPCGKLRFLAVVVLVASLAGLPLLVVFVAWDWVRFFTFSSVLAYILYLMTLEHLPVQPRWHNWAEIVLVGWAVWFSVMHEPFMVFSGNFAVSQFPFTLQLEYLRDAWRGDAVFPAVP